MKNWLWVGYPVAVLLVIVVSLKLGLSGAGGAWWKNISGRQKEIEKQQQEVAMLSARLSALNKIDLVAQTGNLEYLLSVAPRSKQIMQFLGQLGQAAGEAGAEITKYGGRIGEVGEASESAREKLALDVTFVVPAWTNVRDLMQALEKQVPLLKINGMKFALGNVSMAVEQMWQPLVSGSLVSGEVLEPDVAVEKVRQLLTDFETLAVGESTPSGEVSLENNPF